MILSLDLVLGIPVPDKTFNILVKMFLQIKLSIYGTMYMFFGTFFKRFWAPGTITCLTLSVSEVIATN